MKVKITKIAELANARTPNNVAIGFKTIRDVHHFEKPQIGRRFNVGTFSTSGVQKIINSNTFETHNSVYRWKIIPFYLNWFRIFRNNKY